MNLESIEETRIQSIGFAELPALGQPLDGGKFAGITTKKDGTHVAVILLPNKAQELDWKAAIAWAKEQDGELPSRPVASLLFANVKDDLPSEWHWTSEEYNASYAWICNFGNGYFYYSHKGNEFSAVAVRLIPITA